MPNGINRNLKSWVDDTQSCVHSSTTRRSGSRAEFVHINFLKNKVEGVEKIFAEFDFAIVNPKVVVIIPLISERNAAGNALVELRFTDHKPPCGLFGAMERAWGER